jgi:preprotein translocase subunit SecB
MDITKNTQDNMVNDAPHISVQAQYVKDFSFENPHAPGVLGHMNPPPQISLSLDLNINPLSEEDHYEVELYISAKAIKEDITLFLVDLKYAGVFYLNNIPDDQKEVLLAVHCPNIIFPYARKIIADSTQYGGFQPLMIDPIDFGLLYAKKSIEQKQNNEI